MVKIAVASEGQNITEHFGYCANFNIFDIEDKSIVREESIANPGHQPGYLPVFLKDMGVEVIMSGSMGGSAIKIFEENGIEVIVGVSGEAQAAVTAYLEGDLEGNSQPCKDDHHHEDN
ncbi:MAG: NifB/NifX family molybdenum-iron cluster-binding protein [Tissierellaceae bacterium]